MKFKIKFNETELFKKTELKYSYFNFLKKEVKELFKKVFEVKDYKDKNRTIRKAENLKDYEVMKLFGSSQTDFFKIEEIKGGLK